MPGFVAVAMAMVALFAVPHRFFVAATFAAMAIMMVVAWSTGRVRVPRLTARYITIGFASALLLYLVFFAGNLAVRSVGFPGVSSSSESTIYSLIASPSNPLLLQIGVLAFDAAGYESFFRGTLQARLEPRLGVGSAPAVAFVDACLHVATLSPLWVATTFVADLVWGLTFYYGKNLSASLTSHFVWDLAIFVIHPIS